MTLKNPGIPVDENPSRLRLIALPPEGIVILHRNGNEEYLRSCPKCGGRLSVSSAHGEMPKWFCPVAEEKKRCDFAREPMAKMSRGLAEELADVRSPQVCHLCSTTYDIVEIHRRLSRVEVVVSHNAGFPCRAQTIYVFHTFSSSEYGKQEWDEPKPTVEEMLKKDHLPEWTPEEAERKLRADPFHRPEPGSSPAP